MNFIIILIFLFQFYTVIYSIIYSELSENNNAVTMYRCISKIIEIHSTIFDTIVLENCEYENDYAAILFNNNSLLSYNACKNNSNLDEIKPTIYVIQLNGNYVKRMSTLKRYSYWNPRAKFIFISNEKNIKIDFEMFLKENYINNFIIINHQLEILTWNHTDLSRIYESNQSFIEEIGTCTNINQKSLFPQRMFTDYHFLTLRVITFRYLPYTINEKSEQSPGIGIDLARMLTNQLNVKMEILNNPYRNWGDKDNGGYPLTFSYLQNGKADVFVGMWHGNVSENKDFDETISYLFDRMVWFAPVAQPIAQWRNMAYIFSVSLWIATIISIIIYAVIWIILEHKLHQSSPFETMFLILGITLNNIPPYHQVLRSMLALFLLKILIISNTFQGNLISILTTPIYEEQIRNIIDATNKTNYKYGYHVTLRRLILSDRNSITEKIRKREELCNQMNAEICMNRTAYKRDLVMAKGNRFLTYVISQLYTNRDGESLFYIFKKEIFSYPISMLMLKGHPLYDEFNRLLSWLQNGGLIEKLSAEYERLSMKKSEDNDSLNDEDHLALTVNHVLIPFFMLFIGLVFAVIAFIFERFYFLKF